MAPCNFVVVFSVALSAGTFLVAGQAPIQVVEPVSELCLGCICEAISNCNRTLQCNGDVCGIFRITWAYWADSGKPTLRPGEDPNANDAYSNCVNEPVCAGRAVTNYMNKFAQDCNGDGRIDCFDYAAIHRLGGYGCRGQFNSPYFEKFLNCQKQVAQYVPSGRF